MYENSVMLLMFGGGSFKHRRQAKCLPILPQTSEQRGACTTPRR